MPHADSSHPWRVSRRTFLHRSVCLATATALTPLSGGLISNAVAAPRAIKPIDPASLTFLKELASATIESARIPAGKSRGGTGPNATGITLISPGGNYPALWVRDFAMSLDCGLIGPTEILPQLRLIARCQNGDNERRLPSGAIIPQFAIPDHINLAGGAVFYPGTYSSGNDQGASPWGPLPPIDDHYYFIHIAYALWRDGANTGVLEEVIGGLSLLERLEKAFASPACDPNSGAAITTRERRAVGFGFQDSVYLLGALSFSTLLRYRAACQLAELCRAMRRARSSERYAKIARQIAANLVTLFGDPFKRDGWLLAATEVGRQPDVWATLFALHLKVLPTRAAKLARKTVAAAVRTPGNTIEYQGAVRHVPSDRYYRVDQCWESGGGPVNTYQSGAFWHTPTGWLIEALHDTEPTLAREVCDRYLQHLRTGDFRLQDRRAPWECFGINLAGAQNPVYMTSVTLPLAVLQGLSR